MKNELKKLMFSGDTPIPMSEDSGKFRLCMSVFQNYEVLVCLPLVHNTFV